MTFRQPHVPPPGRSASRWFLYLTFYHLLPVIWYMAVAGGLAPGALLLVGGVASLFAGDGDGLAMALFLLAPALLAGLVFYPLAALLTWLIRKLRRPLARSLVLLGIFAVCLSVALQPIFIGGGHGSSEAFTLLDFLPLFDDYHLPRKLIYGYLALLGLVLFTLLIAQHRAGRRQILSRQRWQRRRRLRRRLVSVGLLLLLLTFAWQQRTLLFVKPLAELGFASAQYRLAMVLKEESLRHHGRAGGHQDWLVRAAEQGHLAAANELVKHPRNREEQLRWLTVAAAGGMADAQFQLYRELRSGADLRTSHGAADWLQAAAEGGQLDAQYELGRLYLDRQGDLGLVRDPDRARRWWEQAAAGGSGRAMEELAWRYARGADGFPFAPRRATELWRQLAAGYRAGSHGLRQDQQMAADRQQRADRLAQLEARLAAGEPRAQAELGQQLLQSAGATPETLARGVELLELAASQGDAELQFELGGIFLFGRHQQAVDLPRGHRWWDKALARNHVGTMEYVAGAYQDGRFGYPVDLLRSKALVEKLVEAYRDGRYGVDPDPAERHRWQDELKYLDRLLALAGGDYQSPVELQGRAGAGDLEAQYQLGRQLLVSGPPEQRQRGLEWIGRAAEGGLAEAQYRLVTHYENRAQLMRDDPQRGVALLTAAARQNHLPAMSALALGFEKGRYGLERNFEQAAQWYRKLLQAYQSGDYQGEIDEDFIPFNRRRLVYCEQAAQTERQRAERLANADEREREIIAIEERYRQLYQQAVNALPRGDGSREGKLRFREEVRKLLEHYNGRRDAEIEKLESGR